ncbi:MAG: hemerythrin family protein [Hydrogenophilaceae bacterium]
MRMEIPRLPVNFMNEDHDHAAEQLETMLATLPVYAENHAMLAQACRAFLDHNREHFAREEEAMRVTGFPPYTVHKGEHDRALAWLDDLTNSIASGGPDSDTVRQVIEHDIPAWFIQHIQTMDWATANWISSHPMASSVRV